MVAFDAKTHTEGGTVSITLIGELDSHSAQRFNTVISDVAAQQPERLVLLMAGLTYMSSAGLRCLVFAHQKLGRGVEIVLVAAQPAVAETISMTGFDRSVIMQDPLGT